MQSYQEVFSKTHYGKEFPRLCAVSTLLHMEDVVNYRQGETFMWIILLLLLPVSLFLILICFDPDVKNLRIGKTAIMYTKEYNTVDGDKIIKLEITKEGKIRFLDQIVSRMLYRLKHENEKLDFRKPMYDRVHIIKEQNSDGTVTERKYAEVVNSSTLERIMLRYLVRKGIPTRVRQYKLSCKIKR